LEAQTIHDSKRPLGGLRFLVVDGNPLERRAAHVRDFGKSPGNAYGDTLLSLAPGGSLYDVCYPADAGANLPQGAGLADYNGIALTGSSLHLWNREPAVERQISLAREIFRSKTAFFGSCWGVQMACVAAGGDVGKNPLGRELAFARNVAPTDAGRAHPLLAGRPAAFDAPAIHLDIITMPAGECTILAANALSPIQAAEFRHEGGIFWGVQYHPEFSLTEVASIIAARTGMLADEGFFRSPADGEGYAADLVTLDRDRTRRDIAWKLGLDEEVMDDDKRTIEIRNWIERQVLPMRSQRGRG
jgi:GMP synthase (glutamine-hydrolysing)